MAAAAARVVLVLMGLASPAAAAGQQAGDLASGSRLRGSEAQEKPLALTSLWHDFVGGGLTARPVQKAEQKVAEADAEVHAADQKAAEDKLREQDAQDQLKILAVCCVLAVIALVGALRGVVKRKWQSGDLSKRLLPGAKGEAEPWAPSKYVKTLSLTREEIEKLNLSPSEIEARSQAATKANSVKQQLARGGLKEQVMGA